MRLRSHRQSLVVWTSSSGPAGGHGAQGFGRHARAGRVRGQIRTGALFAVIGLMRLAGAVRARRWAVLMLAGAVLTVAGITVPSGVTFVFGMLVLLRGVAVALGVSTSHRRLDGEPAGAPDYFGFGTPPCR
jgi:hypothetical protein